MYVHRKCKPSEFELDMEKRAGGFCSVCGMQGTVYHAKGTPDYYEFFGAGVLYMVQDGVVKSSVEDARKGIREQELARKKAEGNILEEAEKRGWDKDIVLAEVVEPVTVTVVGEDPNDIIKMNLIKMGEPVLGEVLEPITVIVPAPEASEEPVEVIEKLDEKDAKIAALKAQLEALEHESGE